MRLKQYNALEHQQQQQPINTLLHNVNDNNLFDNYNSLTGQTETGNTGGGRVTNAEPWDSLQWCNTINTIQNIQLEQNENSQYLLNTQLVEEEEDLQHFQANQQIQVVKQQRQPYNINANVAAVTTQRRPATRPSGRHTYSEATSPDDSLVDYEDAGHQSSSSLESTPQEEERGFLSDDSLSDDGNLPSDTITTRTRGIVNPNYPGFQHLAHTLEYSIKSTSDIEYSDEEVEDNGNNIINNNNNEEYNKIDSVNRLDSVENIQKVFYDKPKLNIPLEPLERDPEKRNNCLEEEGSSQTTSDEDLEGSNQGSPETSSNPDPQNTTENFNIENPEKINSCLEEESSSQTTSDEDLEGNTQGIIDILSHPDSQNIIGDFGKEIEEELSLIERGVEKDLQEAVEKLNVASDLSPSALKYNIEPNTEESFQKGCVEVLEDVNLQQRVENHLESIQKEVFEPTIIKTDAKDLPRPVTYFQEVEKILEVDVNLPKELPSYYEVEKVEGEILEPVNFVLEVPQFPETVTLEDQSPDEVKPVENKIILTKTTDASLSNAQDVIRNIEKGLFLTNPENMEVDISKKEDNIATSSSERKEQIKRIDDDPEEEFLSNAQNVIKNIEKEFLLLAQQNMEKDLQISKHDDSRMQKEQNNGLPIFSKIEQIKRIPKDTSKMEAKTLNKNDCLKMEKTLKQNLGAPKKTEQIKRLSKEETPKESTHKELSKAQNVIKNIEKEFFSSNPEKMEIDFSEPPNNDKIIQETEVFLFCKENKTKNEPEKDEDSMVPRKKEKIEIKETKKRRNSNQMGNLITVQRREFGGRNRDNLNRRSLPNPREKRRASPEVLGGFDVYNIETAMPKIDLDAIESHLKAAREEERRRRTDREEIRRRLAMGSEDDYYSGNDRPGRKPSLQSRLQSGMNLQICFMNETASDTDSPNSDNEFPVTKPSTPSPKIVKTPSNKVKQRPASLNLSTTPTPMLEPIGQPMTEADFFARQARLQTEARMALAQAKEMAHMQMEIERQRQKKSPITEMIRSSFEKVGIPFPEERRRVSRQILTEMNVAQLQVIVNDLHTQIETLNEQLVRFLMNRDDLHMEQDSMLVDIEDLTRYLGAKEQTVKEQKINQNNNIPPSPAPASPLLVLNNSVKPRLQRLTSLVKK